jgi:hypothetical protein
MIGHGYWRRSRNGPPDSKQELIMNKTQTADIRELTSDELAVVSGAEKAVDVTIFGVRFVLGSNEGGGYACVFSGGQGGCVSESEMR